MTDRFPALTAAFLSLGLLAGLACSDGKRAVFDAPAPAETAAVVQATAAPQVVSGGPNRVAQSGPPEPSADRAYEHIQKLTVDIGSRVSGTPEEQAAAEYIAEQFRSYGYDVELQRFPVTAFVVRAASLRLADGRAIRARPYSLSRPGSATGEIVFAGLGRAADFPTSVRGKIALVERGEISFREKALNAAQAGATALVIYNNAPDLQVGTLQTEGPALPVLAISGADGQRLRAEIGTQTIRGTATFDGGVTASDSINVIARPRDARCRVVLGGHYDSVADGPGTSDNATGSAATLELARVTAASGNPQTACFIAFGSEETGLNGSKYFVSTLSAEDRAALEFMLNFDMVSIGTEWWLVGTPALQEQGRAILSGMGIAARPATLRGASSDFASFIEGGIPALLLYRSDDPLLHTPEDVIDRVSKENLGEALRIGLAFLAAFKPA